MYHREVSINTSANPVARAVARHRLKQALLEQKIQLYLLADGEPAANVLTAIGAMFAVVGLAAEIDKAIDRDDPELRVMRGGLSACEQMMKAGAWASINAPAIERALDSAFALNKRIGFRPFNEAWMRLNRPVMAKGKA